MNSESEFEIAFQDYHVNASQLIKNSDLPRGKSKRLKANAPTKSKPYFKRVVLAGVIASQLYEEPTFGHVKFQKLIFLCENLTGFDFNDNYTKQAAGPYDNKFMHSIDQQFQSLKWFQVKMEEKSGYSQCKYIPSGKFNDHKKYYTSYFRYDNRKIQYVIDTFRKSKPREVELVATLYSCWQEQENANMAVNEQSLLKSLYDWSEQKKKYSETEVISAIGWMKENGFVPSHTRR